jgi:Ketopantoate reductase PanE/ApbA
VLFSVKAFDTEAAAARLEPLLGKGTAVLSLQNGVDNEDKLAQAIGPDHVMGGAAFIFAGKAGPGVIVHTGGPTSITFGELDGRVSERAQRLLEYCQQPAAIRSTARWHAHLAGCRSSGPAEGRPGWLAHRFPWERTGERVRCSATAVLSGMSWWCWWWASYQSA